MGVWLWPEVRGDSGPLRSQLISSYTSFEMSDLEVKRVDIKDTAAVQVTNELYEGPAGLYDIVVSLFILVRPF